jgi:hypothetical protein
MSKKVSPPTFIDIYIYNYLFLYLFSNVCIDFLKSNKQRRLIERYKVCPESNETDFLGPSKRVEERSLRA